MTRFYQGAVINVTRWIQINNKLHFINISIWYYESTINDNIHTWFMYILSKIHILGHPINNAAENRLISKK